MTSEAGAERSRFAGRRAVARVIVLWLSTGLALLAASAVLPGFRLDSPGTALTFAAVLGLLNALVWPLLIRFALPFTVLTLGFGVLLLNGAFVTLAARISEDVELGLGEGVVVAFGITFVNALVMSLLAVDDDELWFRGVVRRQARKRPDAAAPTDVPGLFFLEIDGLAHDVLQRAIRSGDAPTIARWLREGSHRLMEWETDWSSQTGACQAGLLHGSNDDMPAFRWWEKDRGAAIVSNHPRDAMEIERRRSNGHGLLHADGASRANLLSGDAPHSLLTMSTVLERDRPGRMGQDYFAYFASPYAVMRTALLVIADVAVERHHARLQRRHDVHPRIHRSWLYSLVRAWTTVIQRDLQVNALISDLFSGRPVAYTTFLGYDEVAHHSGIERPDALSTLRRIDRQFARLEAVARDAPRPYRFVVLSDHGQTQGETFLQRYGETLEDLVRRCCEQVDVEMGGGEEGLGVLSAALTEAGSGVGAGARVIRRATRKRLHHSAVSASEARDVTGKHVEPPNASSDAVVMASGCLGLVSFPELPGRATLEQIDARWPTLIPTLREHPGIGFLLVRSEARGALVLGARGVHALDEDTIEGEDPLAPYGPTAVQHVRRTDGFAHCADLMINSAYWPELEEVAAFEELVGSHGGMGGTQSFPFAVVPSELTLPSTPVVGAEAMHRVMRGWLGELGQQAYR